MISWRTKKARVVAAANENRNIDDDGDAEAAGVDYKGDESTGRSNVEAPVIHLDETHLEGTEGTDGTERNGRQTLDGSHRELVLEVTPPTSLVCISYYTR